MRHIRVLATLTGAAVLLTASIAQAGAVATHVRGGAFGLSWNASKATIEAKYPGGSWDADDKGHARYCASSRQTLLKLPAPHQTQQLCFLIGSDNTLASATAVMAASLPSLLAVVNRCRTTFGDFDSVVRDENAIQSRSNAMLWTSDSPYIVRVESQNDADGRPTLVTFTVADEASLYTLGAKRVSNRPDGR
jgi:hypothetical protein